MRFKIHRGAKEIGGNCVEIQARSGERIFLDFGMPLSLPEEGDYSSRNIRKKSWEDLVEKKYLPNVQELYHGDSSNILGIFISHPHQDHYGFVDFVKREIPFYLGEHAKKLIDITSKFTGTQVTIKNYKCVQDRTQIKLGSFEITPYTVDHSAFDAYAFLIKADNKTFFYSGDLRAHGRKKWAFPNLLRDLPKEIDAVMLETTMLGRKESDYVKEEDLESVFIDRMKESKGLVLFESSAQNIDRIVTAFRATLQSGRDFVMDGYTAYVYRNLGIDSLPQDTWDRVRVYFNKAHMVKSLREDIPEELLFPFKNSRLLGAEIAAHPSKYVMCFRQSMIRDFDEQWKNHIPVKALDSASYIYSLWGGYWKKMDEMRKFIADHKISGPHNIHCSGHAYISDLQKLLDTVKPKRCYTIHGFETASASEYFDNVKNVGDGEWEEV